MRQGFFQYTKTLRRGISLLLDRVIWYIGYYCFPDMRVRRWLIKRYATHVGQGVDCHVDFRVHGGNRLYIQDNVKLASTLCGCQADILIGENTFFGHHVMLLTPQHDFTLIGIDRQNTISANPIIIPPNLWIAPGAIF